MRPTQYGKVPVRITYAKLKGNPRKVHVVLLYQTLYEEDEPVTLVYNVLTLKGEGRLKHFVSYTDWDRPRICTYNGKSLTLEQQKMWLGAYCRRMRVHMEDFVLMKSFGRQYIEDNIKYVEREYKEGVFYEPEGTEENQ